MELIKTSDAENEKLLHYFAQKPLAGSIELQLRRMFNFFNQYRIQTDDYVTYVLHNDLSEIEAMASILFIKGEIEGQEEIIGYATDLRVSPTRLAVLNWSRHFLPVLESERKKRNCRYIFSVIPHSQRQAYNALIRPRNLRRGMPRYHLFRHFDLVSLHGLWPFHAVPLPGIKIRTANNNDFAQLAEYILRKTEKRPLRFYNTVENFQQSIERWHDLFVENFLLAFDRHNNIIGCAAPWSSERVQRLYAAKYDDKAANFQSLLAVLSCLRIAHPLAKEGQEFEFRHLTHLFADNPDIFYSLLYNAFKQLDKKEFLLYPHFEGELLTLPPRSFISARTPFGLYCVLPPADPVPEFLKPRSLFLPPVFEPAFI
ncbi:MAG: hypothetical protein A2Z20_08870 [Bdellovibrionales bacterium RBG_16_40_8]|nr:MAG: hypothetical protein A2Z20_08870 [Bdellovibrionales bacterium RBG_16_40_8]